MLTNHSTYNRIKKLALVEKLNDKKIQKNKKIVLTNQITYNRISKVALIEISK